MTDVWERAPVWSPDGRVIAFESDTDGLLGSAPAEIHLVNADGTERRKLATNAYEPAWSPSGDEIAFRSKPPRPNGLYVISPDGTTERRRLGKISLRALLGDLPGVTARSRKLAVRMLELARDGKGR